MRVMQALPPVQAAPMPPSVIGGALSLAEANALTRLQQPERDYLVGMKRKDRNEIVRLIGGPKAVRREAPLRLQVLQSSPHHLRLEIFEDLGHNTCEKYLNWVRKIIRVPNNVLYPRALLGSIENAVRTASERMDSCITGHADAKREVLKLLCQANATGGVCNSNYSLGFEGPPGTGKTHFVRTALALALIALSSRFLWEVQTTFPTSSAISTSMRGARRGGWLLL